MKRFLSGLLIVLLAFFGSYTAGPDALIHPNEEEPGVMH